MGGYANASVQGYMPDRSPIGGDWATAGVRAHLARTKASDGKPVKPYGNDPVVTKAQAAANTGNPFTDVRATRSTRLRLDEVTRVYNAMAFAREVLGRRMNAHLTIRWSAIGVDEVDAQGLLDALLNRAGKWFRKRTADRSFLWARDVQLPDELLWVYVHEKSATYGFHTHLLLSMDVTQWKAFRSWVFVCLAQLVQRDQVPHDVALLRRSYAQHEATEDDGHWRWFRYVIKQLDPEAVMPSPVCDKVAAARDVFEPRHLRADLVTSVLRLVGVCRRLDVGAQMKAGFVSRLTKGLMPYIDLPIQHPLLKKEEAFCLVSGAHGFERDYPGLEMFIMSPHLNLQVGLCSSHQYLAFEAAWDWLRDAQEYVQRAVKRPEKVLAQRLLDEAQDRFAIAEAIINLDRWDLMPEVCFHEGERRPDPPRLRSRLAWMRQLRKSTLKAAESYLWFQSLGPIEIADIVPRALSPKEERLLKNINERTKLCNDAIVLSNP